VLETRDPEAVTRPDESSPAPSGGVASARAFWVALVAAILPIVTATIRAAVEGWVPVGDNGYFAVRARDLFTEHHPLLGTWTSASLNTDTNFNNPGPLLFDLLAPAAKLIPGGIGVAVGSALVNCLAVVGIGLVARRRGGPLLGVAALAVTSALTWSMGSQLLFDPWQPHSLLLAFLLGLLLIWSLVCGDLRALPWAVLVGSVVIQTHLSYAILLAALAGWGVVGLALAVVRRRREDPAAWPSLRRRVVRSVGVAALVGALCWSQPLIEQVSKGSDGNLVRLAGNAATAPETVGPRLGLRIVSSVVALPPFWVRPSFKETLLIDRVGEAAGASSQSWAGPSPASTVGSLGLLTGLLALAWWDARRRRDRVSAAALTTAGVALVAATATAVKLPLSTIGLPAHQYRWLWPVAAFITLALFTAVLRRFAGDPGTTRGLILGLTGLTVVLAGLNLPEYNAEAGPVADEWAIPVVHELSERIGGLEGQGTLLLDMHDVRFAEPWSGWLMVELQRRGIPFVVDDEGMARQLGDARRAGDREVPRILVREGDDALQPPPGAREIALVEGLTPAEQDELRALRADVARHLEELGEFPLNPRGETALNRPDLNLLAAPVRGFDLERVLDGRGLLFLVEHDLIDLEPEWREPFERYVGLQERWDYQTVGIFLAPPNQGATP
jgi:hypothetical protein